MYILVAVTGLLSESGGAGSSKAATEWRWIRPYESTTGWLSPIEALCLLYLAYRSGLENKADVVEIGSFMGKSTLPLAAGCKLSRAGFVYAIDPFDGSADAFGPDPSHIVQYRETRERHGVQGSHFEIFWRNLAAADLGSWVVPIKKLSTDIKDWDRPIRLLFVDGNHSYESALNDYRIFERNLVSGGYVVYHDYTTPDCTGVKQAVDEIISGGKVNRKSVRMVDRIVTWRVHG
ncbi:MAG: class I SAM-dependent methyltransferase [Planctomycetota bacterium]